jgi:hypothetical protein
MKTLINGVFDLNRIIAHIPTPVLTTFCFPTKRSKCCTLSIYRSTVVRLCLHAARCSLLATSHSKANEHVLLLSPYKLARLTAKESGAALIPSKCQSYPMG